MKQLITILTAVLIAATVFLPQQANAQTPDKMTYQAVVRDANDLLVAGQAVGMQISILQGSPTGTVVYTETQTPTTNINGLLSTEVGGGPDFNAINWADGPYFLKTEFDPAGGTDYTITGTSQLLSIPYALHAKTADSVIGGVTEIDPVFAVSVAGGITETDTAYWNGKLDIEVDGDVTNELQIIDIYDNTIYLTDGGSADLPPETDPVFDTSVAGGITAADTANWNAGAEALEINDLTDGKTGGQSVFLGEGAGAADDLSDNHNVFVGYQAGTNNTEGNENTATGIWALKHNTTGTHNTANGSEALFTNSTGNSNTASGAYSLHQNTTGIENTAMGVEALGDNTEGANNTAFGYTALKTNTTGSNNTAFGYEADVSSDNLTNATAIGYKAKVAVSNSLVLGGTGTDAVNVGIGTDSPEATLDIVSTDNGLLIPRMLESDKNAISPTATGLMIYQTDGTSGFYYYDGAVWKSIGAGVLGINDLRDGNTTGTENVFLGQSSGSNNTGTSNTAIGSFALEDLSTGNYNTATGARVLMHNTTGIQNAATGFQALSSNTTGNNNTANGGQALSSNTTGNYNTATGFQALNENTEASYITATGYRTLLNNTTGAENTAIGAFALQTNTTGNNNTAFGYKADVSSDNLSNAAAIGYKAKVATSNSLVLGGFDETGSGGDDNSVNVGIGTDSPGAALDITSTDNGLLIPRLDIADLATADPVTSPVTSLLVYNTNTTTGEGFYYWDSTAWVSSAGTQTDSTDIADMGYISFRLLTQDTVGRIAISDNGGTTANPHTILDLQSTTKGFLLPRLSWVQMLTMPATTPWGMMVLNSNDSKIYWRNGLAWETFVSTSSNYIDKLQDAHSNPDMNSYYIGNLSGNNTDDNAINTTAVGYRSGSGFGTGSSNTAIGAYSGPAAGTTNLHHTTILGYNAKATASHQVVLGTDNDTIIVSNTIRIKSQLSPPAGKAGMLYVETADKNLYYHNGDNWDQINPLKYQVGDLIFGGVICFVDETGQHGLICSPVDVVSAMQWAGGSAQNLSNAQADGLYTGEMNTTLIIANEAVHYFSSCAAMSCAAYTSSTINAPGIPDYGDWYLPSVVELQQIYNNKAAINAAIASTPSYLPIINVRYWSSVELHYNISHAYYFDMGSGTQEDEFKTNQYHVRAVKRF